MGFILFFFLGVFSQASWDLNDVSYLLPLPQANGSDSLLKLQSQGARGVLLNSEYIKEGPPLLMDREDAVTQASLRVVGVRLDPCFPLPVPQTCQRQVRLVWQPLQQTAGSIVTADAALHTFYNLKESEFLSLLNDLQEWKKAFNVRTQGLPLQVHPAWSGQNGKQALQSFQKIILKYVGSDNISRMTMMILRGNSMMWGFLGFDIVDGHALPIRIARLNSSTAQSFVNLSQDDFSRGGMSPAPKDKDSVNNLVAESRRLGADQKGLILEESVAALRIENPKNYNSENMDCASCHVVQPALNWVRRQRPELKIDQGSEAYQNPRYNLENISPTKNHTQVIRSFGYFSKSTAINQRVINESAEVADAINSWLKN